MKLFVDDLRDPPSHDKSWCIARTAKLAIYWIKTGAVDEISLDHDLGNHSKTGYDIACVIEELVLTGKIKMPKWHVHSANPVGKVRIKQALENAERVLKETV